MTRRLVLSLVGILVVVFGGLTANLLVGNEPSLGLDLQGGASVTLTPVGEYEPAALEVAVEIIRARVDSLGVAEPEIISQGDTVVINLPGVEDQDRALQIVGAQGQVLLRPVIQSGTLDTSSTTTAPANSPDPTDPNATVLLTDDLGISYQVGPAQATGDVFENDAQADISSGQWAVVVSLRGGAEGEDVWNALTTKCFNREETCPTGQVAIVLDGVVISAPVVQEPVFTGGTVQISGDFTEEEARDLAKILEFGAVPVEFDVASVQTVSPTLGSDSLRAAIIAGLVGMVLVLMFFFAYYRLLPIVMLLGLTISGSLMWSVIALLSKTNGLALTLAGVAGIIVSIGVTVDSYVVFFERLKDEIQAGRSLRGSAQRSFQSAFRTILIADGASFIGAVVLWYLTVGSVRGFAFFLGLSTLIDVIIAYFYTRPAVLLLARTRLFRGSRVLGVRQSEQGASA
ncbi:MAG: protein translocase subunit SecD [Actinomycetota bacterium]